MIGNKLTLILLATVVCVLAASDKCIDKCRDTEAKDLVAVCERGCRLDSIISATNKAVQEFFSGDFEQEEGPKGSLDKCADDCTFGTSNESARAACTRGCRFQEEVGPRPLLARNDGGFGLSFNLPPFLDFGRFVPGPPSEAKVMGQNGEQGELGSLEGPQLPSVFRRMFDLVRGNVPSVMQAMLNPLSNMREPSATGFGGGKLIVIKSGPGYREEKTYSFGPDTHRSGVIHDDMVNHQNPLEKFVKGADVEVIDPDRLKSLEDDRKPKGLESKGQSGFDVFGPFVFPLGKAAVDGEEGDGTVLPEDGLTGARPGFVVDANGVDSTFNAYNVISRIKLADVCSGDSSEMSWSTWFTCLHARIGLPRWVLAATVCLGIVFTLWVCLVIPSNAPKQKMKAAKNSLGVKELDANSPENPHMTIIGLSKAYPLDLPPSYDDLRKANKAIVEEPVQKMDTGRVAEEGGVLPEKIPLDKA